MSIEGVRSRGDRTCGSGKDRTLQSSRYSSRPSAGGGGGVGSAQVESPQERLRMLIGRSEAD